MEKSIEEKLSIENQRKKLAEKIEKKERSDFSKYCDDKEAGI